MARLKLVSVESAAVSRLGFDPASRMIAVQFTGGDAVYGYPNLTDEEVRQLIAVMENHASLGHYIATVIKPNHDHERIRLDRAAAGDPPPHERTR